MFRFGYRFIDKLSIANEAGFHLLIDDNFNTIEYCVLDVNENVINNFYYNISLTTKKNIRNILESNKELFKLNSNIYSKGEYSEIEQIFYFELDNINRKIECNNIFDIYINNEVVKLLINVFNKIAKELAKENIILKLDSLLKK